MLDFLAGKKTYITAGLIVVAAVAQTFGVVIPEAVWAVLAAFGLGSVRLAVSASAR